MVEASEPPATDTLVADKYRLERLLGRGGMGSVWEGVHTTLGTRVAVKFIEATFANQAEIRDRFFNEAFAAARLKSKHIVQVYDHGVDEGGRPYIVMEFLSGEPMDERLAREGTLSLPDAATAIEQVARAVKRAHEEGIIHRDLKPENIFLVWDEEDKKDLVKVVDFGIAKFTDSSGISSSTRTGAVLGTPHFMSPEQARGLKSIDHRADVWSIGVITYRAVTGALPFDGEAVGDLLVRICTQEPTPPSEHVPVPAEFDAWMRRSLSKDLDERFQSVEEQAVALKQIAAGATTHVGGAAMASTSVTADTALGVVRSTRAGADRRKSRRPWVIGGGLAALGVAAFVAVGGQEPDVATDAASESAVAAGGVELEASAEPSTEPAQPEVRPVAAESTQAVAAEPSAGAGGAAGEAAPAPRPVRRPATAAPRSAPRPPPKRNSPSDELGY